MSVLRKIVPSVYVRTSASGLGLYARPRAQFFSIRTSRPVNNIYLFVYLGRSEEKNGGCKIPVGTTSNKQIMRNVIVHYTRENADLQPSLIDSFLSLSYFIKFLISILVENDAVIPSPFLYEVINQEWGNFFISKQFWFLRFLRSAKNCIIIRLIT